MEVYLTLEWAFSYGFSLIKARRLTEEEKPKYAEWFKDYGLMGIDAPVELDHIRLDDVKAILHTLHPDGEFLGCTNQAYFITEEQWNTFLKLNDENKRKKEGERLEEAIESLEHLIHACENNTLYTDEEAKRRRISYNNLHNEGGYGFVPHFYTFSEYETAKARLQELKSKQEEMNY